MFIAPRMPVLITNGNERALCTPSPLARGPNCNQRSSLLSSPERRVCPVAAAGGSPAFIESLRQPVDQAASILLVQAQQQVPVAVGDGGLPRFGLSPFHSNAFRAGRDRT